jgi:hypothetical protein
MTAPADKAARTARTARDTSEDVADSTPVRWLAKAGYVAYGVVFLVLAWLALRVARGQGGEEADKTGALQSVAESTGGTALLWFIAVGATALALRGLVEAAWGHRRYDGAKRAVKRMGSVVEAGALGAVAVTAVRIASGTQGGGSGSTTTSATASLLDSGAGRVLVGLVGVLILAGAAYVAWRGISTRFLEDLDLAGASAGTRTAVTRLGQAGWAGVGLAYVLVGGFVAGAALTHDAEKAGGLDTALQRTADEPYGVVLLALVAAGFAAYGVFCFFQARFRTD